MTDHKTTLRLSAEDLAVIARLRERLGITSNADVIRFALRYTESHGPMRPKEREMTIRNQQIRAIAEAIAEDPDPEAIRAQNVAGWTVDLGTAISWRRYDGVRLSEAELAQAIAIAEEIRRGPMRPQDREMSDPLSEVLRHYGSSAVVRYVGEKWGPDPIVDTLGSLVANVRDLGEDYLEGIESRLSATDEGEGILYDEYGNAILLLASEDDLED